MVKQEFTNTSGVGYQEPEAIEQEFALGNAFVGAVDKEAYDREMWNALHAQNMLGEEAGPSSIANVTARTSDAGVGNARKRGNNGRDTAFTNAIILQQLQDMLGDIRDQMAVLQADIEFLDSIENDDAIIVANSRDELSNEDQARLDQLLEHLGITEADYFAMSVEQRIEAKDNALEQREVAFENLGDLEERLAELVDSNEIDDVLVEPFLVQNNVFDNNLLEEAAKQWEQVNGELDRYNISVETLSELHQIIFDAQADQVYAQNDIGQSLEDDVEVETIALGAQNLTFNMG